MIRTVVVGLLTSLALVFVLPWLILWSVIAGDPGLMCAGAARYLRFANRLAGIRIHAEGLENLPAGASVLAANHASNADPAALIAVLPRRVVVLVKRELFHIPIFATAMRLAGYVPVDRGSRESVASIAAATAALKQGLSLLVFPEGARSPDGRMRSFKRGAFAAAIDAGVPIVPVSISGSQRVMPKGSRRIYPGDVTIRFGEPVDASRFTRERRSELLASIEARVACGLPPEQQPSRPTSEGASESL